MRDDEIRGRLIETNPWWRATASGNDPQQWAIDDRTLRDRDRYDLGYRSDVLADITSSPIEDTLVLLRGPRRVGKSVVLKDAALSLCGRRDSDPRHVIYLPADGMRVRDLQRAIVLGRELTRSVDLIQPTRRVWLLDEVTAIDGWTTAIKYLRDNTIFGEDTVICTGSSWSHTGDIERDLLAGRAGSGSGKRVRMLLPMRFRDVLVATRQTLPRPDPVPPWLLQANTVRNTLTDLELFTSELDLAWQSYLTSGGFPRAVAEHTKTGTVSESFQQDLLAWLHRDISHDAPLESIPLLLAELHKRSAAPLNRAAIAAYLDYPNRQAFDTRLNRLIHSFAALRCPQINSDGNLVAGAQAKVYLIDPLLAWLPYYVRSGAAAPDMTALTENSLAVAFAAAVDQRQPGRWIAGDTIGYVRTGSGNEVDFGPIAVPTTAGTMTTTPIESKWVSQKWRAEARTIEGRFGHGILATKTITDTDHATWAIPAPVLALLLE